MNAKYLFPPVFRIIGWLMALPGLVLGYGVAYKDYKIPRLTSITDELAITLVLTGLLFVGFSKRKQEDELTARMRLDSLYWAIMLNAVLIVVVSATKFFDVQVENWAVYQIFLSLAIFIGRFYFLLYRNSDAYFLPKPNYLPYRPYHQIGKYVSLIGGCYAWAAGIYELETFFETPSNSSLELFFSAGDVCWSFLPFFLLLWAFSCEREEDEYIAQLRLESMQWAVYLNSALFLLLTWSVYGFFYLFVLEINVVSLLYFYLFIFSIKKYRGRRLLGTIGKGLLLS